jgi:UTP:GlnB (protein PII) uridylyltransferase
MQHKGVQPNSVGMLTASCAGSLWDAHYDLDHSLRALEQSIHCSAHELQIIDSGRWDSDVVFMGQA